MATYAMRGLDDVRSPREEWEQALPTGLAGLRVPPWYRFYPVGLTDSDRAMLAEFGVTDDETLGAIERMRRDFAETFCPAGLN